MSAQSFMKFFPSDWRADPTLRMCGLAARGLWMEMIALMHEAEPRGDLRVAGKPVTVQQLANLAGVPQKDVAKLLAELETAEVFSRDGDGTIFSRRMRRELAISQTRSDVGSTGGRPRKQTESKPETKTKANVKANGPPDAKAKQKPHGDHQNPDTRIQIEVERAPAATSDQLPPRTPYPGYDLDAAQAGLTTGLPETWANFADWHEQHGKPVASVAAAWRRWCRREATRIGERVAQAEATAHSPEADQWRQRLKGWRKSRFWLGQHWGPEPGQPGCRAPRQLLDEAP